MGRPRSQECLARKTTCRWPHMVSMWEHTHLLQESDSFSGPGATVSPIRIGRDRLHDNYYREERANTTSKNPIFSEIDWSARSTGIYTTRQSSRNPCLLHKVWTDLIGGFRILIVRISELVGVSGAGPQRNFYIAKVQPRFCDMDSAAQSCKGRLRHALNP